MENMTLLSTNQTSATTLVTENITIIQEINETNTRQVAVISASPGVVYLSYITLPIFLVVGMCGNSLTIAVIFSKTYRASFHGILITAMAFTDITYMLTVPFSKPFVQEMFGVDVRALSPVGCGVYYTLYKGGKICSAALVCLICLERFVLTWFPLKARAIVNKLTALITVTACTISIATICGILSSFAGVKNGKCKSMLLTPANKQTGTIFSLIGMTLHSFIPTTVLLAFTPPTIFKIFYRRTARLGLQSQSNKRSKDSGPDEGNRACMMLLGVICSYLLLVTPFCTTRNIYKLKGINIKEYPELWAKNIDAVAMICEEANCVINFFLYCLLSRSFRTQLRSLFQKNGNTSPSTGTIRLSEKCV